MSSKRRVTRSMSKAQGGSSTISTTRSPSPKPKKTKLVTKTAPKKDLTALRADYQLLLLRQKLGYERNVVLERRAHSARVARGYLQQKYLSYEHYPEEDVWLEAHQRTKEERQPFEKAVNEILKPKDRVSSEEEAEYKEAILVFSDWKDKGFLETIVQYLDAASLFFWGCAVCGVCVPATRESKNLLEGLGKALMEKTALAAAGAVLVNVHQFFQDPNVRVNADGYQFLDFEHCKYRNGAIFMAREWVQSPWYDSVDPIEKDRLNVQWARKGFLVQPCREAEEDWVWSSGNRCLHAAYHFRGDNFDDESDIDDDCQDTDTNYLGAYTGDFRRNGVRTWLNILLFRAAVRASQTDREYILLEDVLKAVESEPIRFSFTPEKRYTLTLLDGRLIKATLQELASFDPDFKVMQGSEVADDFIWAGLKKIWEDFSSHNNLLEKALANIEKHIKKRQECLDALVEDLVQEKSDQIQECGSGSDEEAWPDTRLEEVSAEDVEVEAVSQQGKIKSDLEAFAKEVLPSHTPEPMPELIGTCWKIFKGLNTLTHEWDSFDQMQVSISASIFLQQLLEEFGLGIAPRPFYIQFPGFPDSKPPLVCSAIFGRKGVTMVQKCMSSAGEDTTEQNQESDEDASDAESESDSSYVDSDTEDM